MKLKFAKLNPAENMTILVTSPVPRQQQAAVAEKLMAYGSVFAEQVGYLETPALTGARARLQMMGGEFCGNASMSLAALMALQDELPDGAEAVYPLEVSGAQDMVNCRIRREGDSYIGTVRMPLPEAITMEEMDPGVVLPVVRFPGIAHVIAFEDALDGVSAKAVIPRWCRRLETDALGILITDGDCSRIRPLVYVRQTDGSVWERGCGSGTAALGAYLAAQRRQEICADVRQPGGSIQVRAAWENGAVTRIEITGRVRIAAIGEAFID